MKLRSVAICVVAIDVAAIAFSAFCSAHGVTVEAMPGNAVEPDILLALGLVLTTAGWLARARDLS